MTPSDSILAVCAFTFVGLVFCILLYNRYKEKS